MGTGCFEVKVGVVRVPRTINKLLLDPKYIPEFVRLKNVGTPFKSAERG